MRGWGVRGVEGMVTPRRLVVLITLRGDNREEGGGVRVGG